MARNVGELFTCIDTLKKYGVGILILKGEYWTFNMDYNDILQAIIIRDKNDTEREVSPLKPASDSVLLDNSGFTPEQTLETVLEIIGRKINV